MRIRLVLAFAAIWLIWGSTYLAIAWVVQGIPPFLGAALRNGIAGILLYAWIRARGAPAPTRRQWKETAIVGILLLGGGNGAVTWAARREPSGVVALLVAMVPLWLLVLGWLGRGGVRPQWREFAGIALGLAGIALLAAPDGRVGGVSLLGLSVLLLSTLAWSGGSLYARSLEKMPAPLLGTGMEMLLGGVALLLLAIVSGDLARFDPSAVPARSLWSLTYLIIAGSIISFSAYKWLLTQVRPALVGTYAFVNPVVAVLLGWAFAGEALTARLILSMLLIVGAVALISIKPARPVDPEPAE